MDAQARSRLPRCWSAVSASSTRLGHAIVLTVVALLACGAALVWARRLTGALAEPLPAAPLLGWMAFLVACAVTFRASCGQIARHRGRMSRYVLPLAASATVLAWAVALSIPGTSVAALVGVWATVVVEEIWDWRPFWRRFARGRASARLPAAAASRSPTQDALHIATISADIGAAGARGGAVLIPPVPAVAVPVESGTTFLPSHVALPSDLSAAAFDPAVCQHLERRRNEQGSEMVEGWLRIDFAAGQRHAWAHVAICPPFEVAPACFAEPADGPSAAVKIAQVLPQGVRLEIKLDEAPQEPTSIWVEFSIQAPQC